jgi:hypothetical protein
LSCAQQKRLVWVPGQVQEEFAVLVGVLLEADEEREDEGDEEVAAGHRQAGQVLQKEAAKESFRAKARYESMLFKN